MRDRLGRVFRFVLVGGANTLVDVALLFVLTGSGMPVVVANTISTSVALGMSFLLNRRFTFRSTGHQGRQIFWFLVVTLIGLWVLQPLIIVGFTALALVEPTALALLIGKILATAVSMTWNYVLYSRVVFRPRHDPNR